MSNSIQSVQALNPQVQAQQTQQAPQPPKPQQAAAKTNTTPQDTVNISQASKQALAANTNGVQANSNGGKQ